MTSIQLGQHRIGDNEPCYFIAELSANHQQDFKVAADTVRAASLAGANAIKLQTYTPDTMTLNHDGDHFKIQGTIWHGRKLYELYKEAQTPWEWHAELKELAESLGLDFFSSPFDFSAVTFLAELNVPAYKIASFEITDLPLISAAADQGKPLIISTGMASLSEIEAAVQTACSRGNEQIVLLKCTSAYPAPAEEANLRTIENLRACFGFPVGLSDHTEGFAVPIAAATLGACLVEKHFILSRDMGGPDSSFSLEPYEFQAMVENVKQAKASLGSVKYGPTDSQKKSLKFRRCVYVTKDLAQGDVLSIENTRVLRPDTGGLRPREYPGILGKRLKHDLERGQALTWGDLE